MPEHNLQFTIHLLRNSSFLSLINLTIEFQPKIGIHRYLLNFFYTHLYEKGVILAKRILEHVRMNHYGKFAMKKSDIAVRGARIVTPHDTIEGDLYVSDGKIIALGRLDLPSQKVVDASGLIILPGMVDAHVHFMDPGEMSREDFPTGSAAAAVAGVTTVIEHNHAGPVYRSEDLSDKVAYLKNRSVVDFGLAAHFSHEKMDDIAGVILQGAAFIKVFTCTTHGVKAVETGPLFKAMNLYGKTGVPFLIHAEDESLTETAERELKATGREDPGVISEWRNKLAERVAVNTVALLTEESNSANVAVAHCSYAAIVDLIEASRSRGALLWSETCPQYLFLKQEEITELGGFRKFTPPARALSSEDLDAMWRRLCNGAISYIASDHAPATRAQKLEESIWDVLFGLPGIDTTLPIMLDAVSKGLLTYSRLVEMYARMPAWLYGFYPRKGALQPGSDADFVLVDPDTEYTLEDKNIISKAGWTPYAGRKLRGKVVGTYLRGHKIAKDGVCVAPIGWGRFVPGRGYTG